MLLLDNPIQPYEWGPVDGLAALVGTDPTGGPEAELWVGTHPRGPSVVVAGEHEGRTLAEVIAADPARWLGPELAAAGHRALPFLLKVLAIDAPLSLQAHPSAEQAEAGFAREEAAGIPIDAPERLYRDPGAKPELLAAIVGTRVLSGFRSPAESRALVAALGVPALDGLLAALDGAGAEAVRAAWAWVLERAGDAPTAAAVAAAAGAAIGGGDAADLDDAFAWVVRLAAAHPGDLAAIAPLLLQLRYLPPSRATALGAGNLHAYLEGAGVEVMAASDNVLRGGLTTKHVDAAELLRVLSVDAVPDVGPAPAVATARRAIGPGPGPAPRPTTVGGAAAAVYDPGFAAFGLVRVALGPEPVELAITQPSLLLPVSAGGLVDVAGADEGVEVGGGAAVHLSPGEVVTVCSTAPEPVALWWATTRAGLPA